jgi:uncharacterized protein YjbJ (UPF0337 family)
METTERTSQQSSSVSGSFEQQWPQLRQQVKGWWDRLTDADLALVAGSKDQLVRAIQGRYGYARERAEQEVERRLHEVAEMPGTSRVGQLKEAAGSMAQDLASEVTKVATEAQKMASTAATSVADTVGRAGAFLPEVPGGIVGLIRRYPVPSLMVGVGLGFLLGRSFGGTARPTSEDATSPERETGYPEALIQCTRCGQMVRQADIISHSTACRGPGQPSHGGSTS